MKKENKEIIERVAVHLRIRPFNAEETEKDSSTPFEKINQTENLVCIRKDFDQRIFNYDTISDSDTKQAEIFEKTSKEIIDSVLNGYNGTILAYGQTGTGKTHTMVGDFEDNFNKGIIPRSFEYIFNLIENKKDFKYNVSLSFIQIYLETIQDLIEVSNNNIKIREDIEKGVYLEGVQWINVKNKEECKKVFLTGEKNRAVGATKSNISSSRSHAILIIQVEKKIPSNTNIINELNNPSNNKQSNNILNMNNNNSNKNFNLNLNLYNQNENKSGDILVHKSQLFLVDLAGSERVKKSKAKDLRLEEAKKINASLLILGNCIQALSERNGFIPYRDSKLTRILQESLGGNAKTSLIVTVSPSSYHAEETICSLAFGQRAMKVQNKPMLNEFVDYENVCKKLSFDLDKLNDEYLELKNNYEKVVEENNQLKEKIKNINPAIKFEKDSKSLSFDDLEKSHHIIINNEEQKEVDPYKKIKGLDSLSASSANESDSIESSDLQIIKEKYEKEIAKLENFYEDILKTKMLEHEQILGELNKKLNDKENDLEQFKIDNMQIREKYNELVDIYHESEENKANYKQMLLELKDEYEDIKLKLDQISEKRNNKENNDEQENIANFNEDENRSEKGNNNININDESKISNTINSKFNVLISEDFNNKSISLNKFNKDMTQKIDYKEFFNKTKKLNFNDLIIEKNINEEFIAPVLKTIKTDQSIQTTNDSFSDEVKDILSDQKLSSKQNNIISFENIEDCLTVMNDKIKKNNEIIKDLKKEKLESKENAENKKIEFEKFKKRTITEYNEKIAEYVKEINHLKINLTETESFNKVKTNKLENYLKNEIKIKEEENVLLKKTNNNLRNELNINLDKMEKLLSEIGLKEKAILEHKKSESENKKVKQQIFDLKKIVNKFKKNCEIVFEKNINILKNNEYVIKSFTTQFAKLDYVFDKILNLKNNKFKFDHEKNKIINSINENLLNIHNELNEILKSHSLISNSNNDNLSSLIKQNSNKADLINKNYLKIPKSLMYLTLEDLTNQSFADENNFNKNENANINYSANLSPSSQIRHLSNKNLEFNLNLNICKYEEVNNGNSDDNCKQKNLSNSIKDQNNISDFNDLKSKSIPLKNKNVLINDFQKSLTEEFLNKSIEVNNDTVKKHTIVSNRQDSKLISFDSLNNSVNNFFQLLNESKKKIYFSFLKFSEFLKFSIEITSIIKQKNELYNNETKNISLELELSKKSEFYYRNRFIDFLQNLIKEISQLIPISKFEDVILDLSKLSSNINETIAPDLVEKSHKIVLMIKNKIDLFLNEKNVEISNLNDKIFFFLKENQSYKKIISETKVQNLSSIKNSYTDILAIKDNEIARLNDLISNLNEKVKADCQEKRFNESRINIIEYRDDLDKTSKNNISINLSEDIREHKQNKNSHNEKDITEFLEFKNNISKYDNEIIELRKTLKENQFKQEKKEHNKPDSKDASKFNKIEEQEVLKKSLYLKERLKKAVQKPEKRK